MDLLLLPLIASAVTSAVAQALATRELMLIVRERQRQERLLASDPESGRVTIVMSATATTRQQSQLEQFAAAILTLEPADLRRHLQTRTMALLGEHVIAATFGSFLNRRQRVKKLTAHREVD